MAKRRALVLAVLLVTGCTSDGSTVPAAGPDQATITLRVDGLDGVNGTMLSSWVLPVHLNEEKEAFGGVQFAVHDGYPASGVMHPQGEHYWDTTDEIATFEPGVYRLIVEVYVPSGPMRSGCEKKIRLTTPDPVVVTITELPVYTGGGWHWTKADELRYPWCRSIEVTTSASGLATED